MADEQMQSMMAKAKDFQIKMEELQREMANTKITGESGAGAIKVHMTGDYVVHNVEFVDETLHNETKETVGALIAAAVNDAIKKVANLSKERMSALGRVMGLPV